ncbi:MAG: ERCC4 domain-containing protein [archaeon]
MIFINSHEPKELIDFLSQKTEIEIENFNPGDFIIGKIGIERKTLDDYLTSLSGGRLFEQLNFLKEIYPKPLLIIEAIDFSVVNWNYFHNSILFIMFDIGIRVIFSRDIYDTAGILHLISKKENKVNNIILKNYFLKYKKRRDNTALNRKKFVMNLLGVGNSKATSLLNSCKTLSELFALNKNSNIRGIGRKTLIKIDAINKL